jgi:endonuclease/exonuclease/phosphatase family metal-dependent hydrolase
VATGQKPDLQLRLACYNIAHGRGLAESNWQGGSRAERTTRLDQIAQLLRNLNADIVVLNEVDFDSTWSHSINQAQYLAELAEYAHWTEQRNLDFRLLAWKWRFGNAVLSKYPIVEASVVDLPAYSTWEPILAGKKRGVVCDIQVGDQRVRIIGAHLSHRSESVRVASAALLGEIAAERRLPTFVAGDLNSTPPGFPESDRAPDGGNAIGALDRSRLFRRSPQNQPVGDHDLTYHSADPRSVIDWILIPSDWHFLRYGVERSQLSDHRPVYADVAAASSGAAPPVH